MTQAGRNEINPRYAVCIRKEARMGKDNICQGGQTFSGLPVQLFSQFIDQWEPCIAGVDKLKFVGEEREVTRLRCVQYRNIKLARLKLRP
jgi:hypothetical protein